LLKTQNTNKAMSHDYLNVNLFVCDVILLKPSVRFKIVNIYQPANGRLMRSSANSDSEGFTNNNIQEKSLRF